MNKWTCPECQDTMRTDRETQSEVDVYCPTCGYEDCYTAEELYGREEK